MVDQLERTTNLLALLLETRSPLTLEDIVNQLSNQYPAGHAAMRGAFERDKSLLRDVGVPIETEVLGGTRAGQTAYRVDRDRYELRDLDLTDAERRALQVAVAAARTTEAESGMLARRSCRQHRLDHGQPPNSSVARLLSDARGRPPSFISQCPTDAFIPTRRCCARVSGT